MNCKIRSTTATSKKSSDDGSDECGVTDGGMVTNGDMSDGSQIKKWIHLLRQILMDVWSQAE